jgi:hypothetical protein
VPTAPEFEIDVVIRLCARGNFFLDEPANHLSNQSV